MSSSTISSDRAALIKDCVQLAFTLTDQIEGKEVTPAVGELHRDLARALSWAHRHAMELDE